VFPQKPFLPEKGNGPTNPKGYKKKELGKFKKFSPNKILRNPKFLNLPRRKSKTLNLG